MTPDPLAALLIGAFGASAIGLLGAWIQGRREHVRWLREKRFDAYRAFMVDMNELSRLRKSPVSTLTVVTKIRRTNKLNDRFPHSYEAVSLLGPKSVNAAGQAWVSAAAALKSSDVTTGRKALDDARWTFLLAAGRVLDSRNVGGTPLEIAATEVELEGR